MDEVERKRIIESGEWREWVIREASSWEGTPYVPHGRVKGVGVDCGGVVYQSYTPLFGPFPPFPTGYAPDWALHTTKELYLDFIAPFTKEVPFPERGGITIYHYGLVYSHAAIYADNDEYIHAWGRLREGTVVRTKSRTMNKFSQLYCNGFQPRHFIPVSR